jgi:hypothetical protein
MDPSSEARVDRMEADGLITAKQADMLRASMAAGASRSQAAPPAALAGPDVAGGGAHSRHGAGQHAVVFQPAAGPVEVQDVSDILNQPDGVGAMNRSLMTALVLVVFLAVAAGLFLWTYNGLVNREEQVFAAWGQVESNLQRRADLTPQLVETVSRYLRHEGETFQNIAEARSQDTAALQSAIDDLAKAMQDSAEQLQRSGERIVEEEDSLAALAAAQARMDRSINTLMATAEAYPELRSSDQFLELQAQLEGTENRVNVTRMRFNELVGDYNASIRRVPGALVATVGQLPAQGLFPGRRRGAQCSGSRFRLACCWRPRWRGPGQHFAAADPQLVEDEAGLLSGEQRDKIALHHAFLLSDHDIDYRLITVRDAGDIVGFGAERFQALEVGSLSEAGRGLLLVIDPEQDRVRLEVGHALEGVYTDGFVAYIENRQMVPFFQAERIADGVLATTELIVSQAQEATARSGFDVGPAWPARPAQAPPPASARRRRPSTKPARTLRRRLAGGDAAGLFRRHGQPRRPQRSRHLHRRDAGDAEGLGDDAGPDGQCGAQLSRRAPAEPAKTGPDRRRAVIRYAPAQRQCSPWFLAREAGPVEARFHRDAGGDPLRPRQFLALRQWRAGPVPVRLRRLDLRPQRLPRRPLTDPHVILERCSI